MQRLSVSAVVVPPVSTDGMPAFLTSLSGQSLMPDEVVLVHSVRDASLGRFCRNRNIRQAFRQSDKPFTRRVNIGLSFSTAQIVCIFRGRETFGDTLFEDIHSLFCESQTGVVILRNPRLTPFGDLLIARRDCFLYGSLDERFGDSSLSVAHWFESIYKGAKKRVARFDEYRILDREDLWCRTSHEHALRGLALGWGSFRSARMRLRLLGTGVREASLLDLLSSIRHAMTKTLFSGPDNPYFGNRPYVERTFWENTTREYVKWEVFQPDEEEIEEVLKVTRPKMILELGCGAGRNFRYYPPEAKCVGLDLSMNLLQRAQDKVDQNILGMICGTATHLSFKDGVFDLVFADSTIQHIPPDKIDLCVSEIVRVAGRYVCLIEYTQEDNKQSQFFSQIHCFKHDYLKLFSGRLDLISRREVAYKVQPAVKELFLFKKRVP